MAISGRGFNKGLFLWNRLFLDSLHPNMVEYGKPGEEFRDNLLIDGAVC